MRVLVTSGAGSCGHVAIRDSVSGELIANATLAELKDQARDNDPLLMQMRVVIKASGATTKLQAKNAIEAAEFI